MSTTRFPRRTPMVVLAGAAGTALIGLTMTGTLSAFTASIQNSANNLTSGTLVMQETDGTSTCTSTDGSNNSATCTTINKYGGQTLQPGDSTTTTVTIKNVGTATPKTFTLTPGTCSQSTVSAVTGVTPASDLCSKVNVKVYANSSASGTPLYDGTLAGFGSAVSLTTLAPNASQQYTFKVTLDSSATNAYMGLKASQPLTWTFTS